MATILSRDGTRIAYEKHGNGPALVIVPGALCDRACASNPDRIGLLSRDFTVYTYDRRGKGESGDTLPYAVEREIEDLWAVIDAAGGSAFVYGHSSGGALALQAAGQPGTRIKRLALYEVPYNDDLKAKAAWKEYIAQLARLLAEGKKGDAVASFFRLMGTPPDRIAGMRNAPFWPAMEAMAPTLAYDHTAILGPENAVPADLAVRVTVPTLVMSGDAGLPFMKVTAGTLSRIIPHALLRILEGQTHEVRQEALAPVLLEFFLKQP